jgi:CO/xanthine dehydrogenase FAD-binding subunit
MITAYHRPATLEEALSLLSQPAMIPLGGGTLVNTPAFDKSLAVSLLDLQALGLDRITASGKDLQVGATVTLEQLLQSGQIQAALGQALHQEAPLNVRNLATVAGTLVAADGRSPFATVMLALDSRLTLETQGSTQISGLGDVLPLRPEILKGKLITRISLPLNVELAYESVARTPADKPILSAALARWPGGRLRLAMGGFGTEPILGMDATDPTGLQPAARHACQGSADAWASEQYRMDVAAILARRCLTRIESAQAP